MNMEGLRKPYIRLNMQIDLYVALCVSQPHAPHHVIHN